MSAIGLILDGLAAMLIAYGQWRVGTVTTLWLSTLDQAVRAGGAPRLSAGADHDMQQAVRVSKWISMTGWALFVLGIALQVWPTLAR